MKAIIGGIVAMPFMVTASQAQSVCYQGTTCNLSGLDINNGSVIPPANA